MDSTPIPFPRLDAVSQSLSPSDEQTLTAGGFDVAMDAGQVAGLLATCRSRAGEAYASIALRLLLGYSRTMAVVGSGVPIRTMNDHCMRDQQLSAALSECENIGFSRHEAELYRRAHAGAEDRGSGRMLEMILKARGPQYREKYQVEHQHILAAEQATGAALAGWRAAGALDDGYSAKDDTDVTPESN